MAVFAHTSLDAHRIALEGSGQLRSARLRLGLRLRFSATDFGRGSRPLAPLRRGCASNAQRPRQLSPYEARCVTSLSRPLRDGSAKPRRSAARGGPHASEIRVIETRSCRSRNRGGHRIALEALTRGDAIARRLPRGYGPLRDQLSRALQSAYLQTGEGAAKSGGERRVRLTSARAEAGEAVAALEAIVALGLGSRSEAQAVIVLLSRLCATLTGLCKKAGG